MAGMKGEGNFQQTRPEAEYAAAVERAIALGHGGAVQVAKETGIPVDTLRPKIQRRKKELQSQPSQPVTIPPVPDNNPLGQMADRAIYALWVEVCRLTDPEAIHQGMKVDVKRLGECGTTAKTWDGVGKTNPAAKQQRSALSSLNKNKAESGSLAA